MPADETLEPIAHDEWMTRTTAIENEIRNAGRQPVRVAVHPAELESWCRHHGVRVDKAAIAAYTEMRLGLERGRGVPNEPRDTENDLLKKLLAVFSSGR